VRITKGLPPRLGADNLATHTATQPLVLADYDLCLRPAGNSNHGLKRLKVGPC
jgi:hypothetical protein